MSDLNRPTPELDPLVARLRRLAPSEGKLNHDRVIFESGRAKGLREARFWMGLASCIGMVCIIISCWMILLPASSPRPVVVTPTVQPTPQATQFVPIPIVIPMPSAPESPAPPQVTDLGREQRVERFSAQQAWNLRQEVLRQGIERLRETEWSANAVPRADSIDELLPPEEAGRPLPSGSLYLFPR